MKKAIAAVFVAAIVTTVPAIAQPTGDPPPHRFGGPGGGGPGGPGMACLMDYLELTDDQIAAWDDIQAEIHGTVEGKMSDLMAIREQIRSELDGDSPDATTLGELLIASHQLEQELRSVRETGHDELAGLLTDAQREKFDIITGFQETCHGGFGGGMGFAKGLRGGRGGHGGPPQ